MTEQPDLVKTTVDEFAQARGVRADERWAGAVAVRFALEEVDDALARNGLREALDMVRHTQESPEELFGDPGEWAAGKIEEWRAEGEPVDPLAPRMPWSQVPVLTPLAAALLTGMLLLVMALAGDRVIDYTWGLLLLPIIGALTVNVTLALYESTLRRASRGVAAAAGLGVIAAGVAILTTIFMVGNNRPVLTASVWWQVLLIVFWAAVTWVVATVVPERPVTTAAPRTDEEWLAQLAGVLRVRKGMGESRVQRLLAEAREHAAATGRSLPEEFGSPSSYASRFPQDETAVNTRKAWLYTIVTPIAAILAFGDFVAEGMAWSSVSWPFALLTVVIGLSAIHAWRDAKRH